MTKLKLSIMTPKEEIFYPSKEIISISMTIHDGIKEVLPGHEPFTSQVHEGCISIRFADASVMTISNHTLAYCRVEKNNNLKLLIRDYFFGDELDLETVENEISEARLAVETLQTDSAELRTEELVNARRRLKRAESDLMAVRGFKKGG